MIYIYIIYNIYYINIYIHIYWCIIHFEVELRSKVKPDRRTWWTQAIHILSIGWVWMASRGGSTTF